MREEDKINPLLSSGIIFLLFFKQCINVEVEEVGDGGGVRTQPVRWQLRRGLLPQGELFGVGHTGWMGKKVGSGSTNQC